MDKEMNTFVYDAFDVNGKSMGFKGRDRAIIVAKACRYAASPLMSVEDEGHGNLVLNFTTTRVWIRITYTDKVWIYRDKQGELSVFKDFDKLFATHPSALPSLLEKKLPNTYERVEEYL